MFTTYLFAAKIFIYELNHFGLPAEFPVFKPAPKACGPPDEDFCPDQRADLYDEIEPSPPDD